MMYKMEKKNDNPKYASLEFKPRNIWEQQI